MQRLLARGCAGALLVVAVWAAAGATGSRAQLPNLLPPVPPPPGSQAPAPPPPPQLGRLADDGRIEVGARRRLRLPAVIRVTTAKQHASATWRSGQRSGTLAPIGRTGPDGAGRYHFRFRLEDAPRGRVRITVAAALPFLASRTIVRRVARRPRARVAEAASSLVQELDGRSSAVHADLSWRAGAPQRGRVTVRLERFAAGAWVPAGRGARGARARGRFEQKRIRVRLPAGQVPLAAGLRAVADYVVRGRRRRAVLRHRRVLDLAPGGGLACSACREELAPGPSAVPGDVPAQALYVSPGGSDRAGGSRGAPVRTIGRALALARGGETVLVGPGRYPRLDVSADWPRTVTVRGLGGRPVIEGAHLDGVRRLRLEHLAFAGNVRAYVHGSRPAADVDLVDSEVGSQGTCVTIRDGVSDIRLIGNYIHGCAYGIGGPGGAARSAGIAIEDNLLEDFTGDGIQFGNWSRVRIERNVIRRMRDPAQRDHNDGIQVYGSSSEVAIRGNEVSDSRHQLVLVQDATGRAVDDLTVEDNLLHGAGTYALQSIGTTRAAFISNTVADARDGGLSIQRGPFSPAAQDNSVVSNILPTLVVRDGAQTSLRARNVIGRAVGGRAPDDVVTSDPGFTGAGSDPFAPRAGSPALGKGDPSYTPALDVHGVLRPPVPSIGALR